MVQVAVARTATMPRMPNYIFGGCSMGAAAAVFCQQSGKFQSNLNQTKSSWTFFGQKKSKGYCMMMQYCFQLFTGSQVWAALLSPRCVRGLVLYMVPTMWAGRKTRRGVLEANANAVRMTNPDRAEVMLGAARADFPPREDVERLAASGIQVLALGEHQEQVLKSLIAAW